MIQQNRPPVSPLYPAFGTQTRTAAIPKKPAVVVPSAQLGLEGAIAGDIYLQAPAEAAGAKAVVSLLGVEEEYTLAEGESKLSVPDSAPAPAFPLKA